MTNTLCTENMVPYWPIHVGSNCEQLVHSRCPAPLKARAAATLSALFYFLALRDGLGSRRGISRADIVAAALDEAT